MSKQRKDNSLTTGYLNQRKKYIKTNPPWFVSHEKNIIYKLCYGFSKSQVDEFGFLTNLYSVFDGD